MHMHMSWCLVRSVGCAGMSWLPFAPNLCDVRYRGTGFGGNEHWFQSNHPSSQMPSSVHIFLHGTWPVHLVVSWRVFFVLHASKALTYCPMKVSLKLRHQHVDKTNRHRVSCALFVLCVLVGGTNRHRSLKGGFVWRYFWGSHQRFFRDLCIASKVPATIEQAKQALENDKVR